MTDAPFSVAITSDPQYPWYDKILPDNLPDSGINDNSNRQIVERYQAINALAYQRKKDQNKYSLETLIVNGDLTAYGHDWQYDKYVQQIATINTSIRMYPSLGNHDYQNNVNDTFENNAARRMVDYMFDWLKGQKNIKYNFFEEASYGAGFLRKDYTGSLAYSFNIGSVHIVQLQNYPTYAKQWNGWNAGAARRDFYDIMPSIDWLRHDLAASRNNGDIIIVFLHDYGDNFSDTSAFDKLVDTYKVSAVFAGHIHGDCGLIQTIGASAVPFFRSGAASYQDFLLADIDPQAKTMSVTKFACPSNGSYAPSGTPWPVTLKADRPNPPMPVPPETGFVVFTNQGGFEAQFYLNYKTGDGQAKSEQTGTMRLGNTTRYAIPPDATDVEIKGTENTGLAWEKWRTVFDLKFTEPPNKTYRLKGTTLHPSWDNG